MNKRIFQKFYILLALTVLGTGLFFLASSVFAQDSMPGQINESGTYFEIKDSEYLNIILKSTEEIKMVLQSIPRMINLDISSSTDAFSTVLTINGLEPNKTYFKYEDNYASELFFFNSDGNYTFTQDLTQSHRILIQEEREPSFLFEKWSGHENIFDVSISTIEASQNLSSSSFSENPIELFTIPDEIKVSFAVSKEFWQPESEFQIGEWVDLIIGVEWLRAGSHPAIAENTTFIISDEMGNIIWERSLGFIGQGWTCCPGGGWGVGVGWSQLDKSGNPVSPGLYKAGVIFTEPNYPVSSDFSGIITFSIIDIREPVPAGWSEDIRLTDNYTAGGYPSLAVDLEDNLHLIWYGGPDLYYMKTDQSGNKLVGGTKIASQAVADSGRQIAVDSQGNLHIVWQRWDSISYAKLDNYGKTLISERTIFSSIPQLSYPSVIVDSDDNLHISINEWTKGAHYLKLNNNGDILIEKQSIGEHKNYWSGVPSIAVDLENNAYLVWFSTVDVSIHLAKLDNAGNIIIDDLKISKTLKRWEAKPKIAIDSEGDIHVAWQNTDENNIWQVYYTKINNLGGTLIPDKVITNRVAQEDRGWIEDISISLDSNDNLHIVWPDNRDGNYEIYYTKIDYNGNILTDDVRLTSYGGYSLRPSIEVGLNNRAYVVWYDDRHGFSDIYYKYQSDWEAPSVPVSVISGKVTDGYAHNLSDIEVKLLYKHPLFGEVVFATTKTNKNGEYLFTDTIPSGTYKVMVSLNSRLEISGPSIFEVLYNAGPTGYVKTLYFTILEGEKKEVNINFADPSLVTDPTIPQERLPDMAAIYFHVKQVVDFTKDVLGVSLDLDLPITVHAFSTLTNGAFYDPNNHNIYIGEKISNYSDKNRPMNREWHESFHEVMDDTIGIPSLPENYYTHDGYNNPSTMGSWIEGWAEFWPCVLKRTLGELNPHIYVWWGKHTSFEKNWKTWDTLGFWIWKQSKEEFAVASLLWDTIDPINSADDDFINLSIEEVWSIIGSEPLADMRAVYERFISHNIGSSDSDNNGISDLDELFIAHGFFADTNENKKYDIGEEVGWGGRSGRRNIPDIPGTYLLVNVIDENGNFLSSSTLMVDVFFDPPEDIYNYSYEEELEAGDNLVGFAVAPAEEEAIIQIQIKDGQGNLSDTFIMTNPIYWESVEKSTLGYAAEHIFQIGATSRTTILANIDFQPEVLNLESSGQWITGYVELPTEYNVTEIDISTVLTSEINSEILAIPLRAISSQEYGFVKEPEFYDTDNDGILELMVKFNRKELLALLNSGQYSLIITGKLKSGVEFRGVDFIKVIP